MKITFLKKYRKWAKGESIEVKDKKAQYFIRVGIAEEKKAKKEVKAKKQPKMQNKNAAPKTPNKKK